MGRCLTKDPEGFVDSTDLYQYVFNNPMKYVDPQGDFAQAVVIPICASTGPVGWILGICAIAAVALVDWEKVGQNLGILNRSDTLPTSYNEQALEKEAEKKKKKEPPYSGKGLGDDPTKCPEEGFEWAGRGEIGSKRGSWSKGSGDTKESLHPDLDHPPPQKPHWNYYGPEGKARLNLDGTWEWK